MRLLPRFLGDRKREAEEKGRRAELQSVRDAVTEETNALASLRRTASEERLRLEQEVLETARRCGAEKAALEAELDLLRVRRADLEKPLGEREAAVAAREEAAASARSEAVRMAEANESARAALASRLASLADREAACSGKEESLARRERGLEESERMNRASSESQASGWQRLRDAQAESSREDQRRRDRNAQAEKAIAEKRRLLDAESARITAERRRLSSDLAAKSDHR